GSIEHPRGDPVTDSSNGVLPAVAIAPRGAIERPAGHYWRRRSPADRNGTPQALPFEDVGRAETMRRPRGGSLVEVNRRIALEVMGALGASTLAPALARADLPAALPRQESRSHHGVKGRMTGAKAAVAALCCEGVHCV